MKALFRCTIPLVLVLPCFVTSLADASSAASGRRGSQGRAVTLTLTSQPIDLNLSGGNGGDGQDGHRGSSGRCSGRPNSSNRRGGDGQDGGNGGDGGDGGRATLIYSNPSQLQFVRIYAPGGRKGEGGRGGKRGEGCPDGRSGSNGRPGQTGRQGSIHLVSIDHSPLQEDTSSQVRALSDLLKGVSLTRQVWELRPGAHTLLAPGSIVQDVYSELMGYEQGSAQVTWGPHAEVDPQLLNDFFSISFSGGVSTLRSDRHVMEMDSIPSPSSHTQFQISRIYRQEDFESLRYAQVSGAVGARQIELQLNHPLIPAPELKLHLKVEVKVGIFAYRELYLGEVEPSLISVVSGGYRIDLDRLPLSERILSRAKLRLTMRHHLQEQSLVSSVKSETWVTSLP